jgi:hypothetical protein
MKPPPKASAANFKIVYVGPAGVVRMAPDAYDEYCQAIEGKDELSAKRKAHLERYFKEFCTVKPHRLTDEKFKKEGNFSDGIGGKSAVWAFKAWKWRLYGVTMTVDGQHCFVGLRVDPAKKKDKADKKLLKNTALDAGELKEYQG